MLDTKRSWDELVLRHAPDEETAYRILDNRLYHNVTGRFVQSHDYIAMERLFDLHASGIVRPHRDRHAAHPQRDRLPRGAGAHGASSSAGACCGGSPCRTGSAGAAARG